MRLYAHPVRWPGMLVFVLLSGCGTSGALLKEQEVVIVEKIIKAATYHPERPPEIRPAPTTKGEDFFKAVNVQVVGAAFLTKLAEVYPPGYFEDEDIAILLDAAVAWMGEEIPDAFFCMGDPQLHELEIWQESVKMYVSGAVSNFIYYEKLE